MIRLLRYLLILAPVVLCAGTAIAQPVTPREQEPNDAPAPATEVVYPTDDSAVLGQVSSSADIDYYAYDLDPGLFSVSVRSVEEVPFCCSAYSAAVSIEDSVGTVLVSRRIYDDNAGSAVDGFYELGAQIAVSGRYYVRVSQYSTLAIFDSDYEIHGEFDAMPMSPREQEANDTAGSGTEVVYPVDGSVKPL